MGYMRRAAQWAGGVGMSEAPARAGSGRVASHLTRGPRDVNRLQRSTAAGNQRGVDHFTSKLQRRGTKRLAGFEGARQLTGIGPLTIGGGSSGSSGIEPKSSGAVGLPPPHSSGGMQY